MEKMSIVLLLVFATNFSLAWEPEEATITDPVAEQVEYVNETVPEVYEESYVDRVSTSGGSDTNDSSNESSSSSWGHSDSYNHVSDDDDDDRAELYSGSQTQNPSLPDSSCQDCLIVDQLNFEKLKTADQMEIIRERMLLEKEILEGDVTILKKRSSDKMHNMIIDLLRADYEELDDQIRRVPASLTPVTFSIQGQ